MQRRREIREERQEKRRKKGGKVMDRAIYQREKRTEAWRRRVRSVCMLSSIRR